MRRAGTNLPAASSLIVVRWSLMLDWLIDLITGNGQRMPVRFTVVIPALNAETSVGDARSI